ncbi:phosphate-starvation-inducible protein PsiE [Bacillus sp. AFS017336]|uniref:phosphate-starvation-inducible protein PsiE n=1 Tax=Bacillus sp. AFS017336 TaxID=2033489 RepID=UPI000BF0AC04|nr:phosphate-starvation-inducible PsiE family protein [Bacillus sp. AFS017336]PEL13348.1 phosphate-starvation-inducible protein PsiE [Bacillus sp. AFS017336]
MSWLKNRQMLIRLHQTLLNISLLLLSLILAFFLFRELYYIFNDVLLSNKNVHQIFGKVLIFFLYFGFISIIVQYFKENYHFPIRYLLYIGITATIRFIIVNNGESAHNFWLAIIILVLTISYIILPFGETRNG